MVSDVLSDVLFVLVVQVVLKKRAPALWGWRQKRGVVIVV
jgi:hypothetical protein